MKNDQQKRFYLKAIMLVLAMIPILLSTWLVSAHQAHPTSGNPRAIAHNENQSPGFGYNGWTAPYTGYFSIYEQGGIAQIRLTVTLSRVGAGSGGGSYQAVWYPNASSLNRFDTPIRINAGEIYNIRVYEQEIVSGHSGWYESEGWLPPRWINLAGSDIACGVGDHPFSSIMIAMGKSGRFLTRNVFDTYNSTLSDMVTQNPAIQLNTAASFLIKPGSVAWGDNSLGIQCWGDNAQFDGDWVYNGIAYSDDIDFEDFTILWAFNPTSVSVPSVQVKINAASSDYAANEPASYVVSWSSSNVSTCTGAGGLAGQNQRNGQITINSQLAGSYDYSMTCSNGVTAVSDTRRAVIYALPAIDVTVDNFDNPPSYPVPASYTVRWVASKGSVSCTGSDGLFGRNSLSGSLLLNGVSAGTHTYSMTCDNGHGAVATDSVTVSVMDPPLVDLKVETSDGPVTLSSPASFTLSWVSQAATSCMVTNAEGAWSGSKVLNGNQFLVGVTTGTHTYGLTCSNPYGSASDAVTVLVIAPLSGTISQAFSSLLLYAPNLGLPAQSLSGNISGGSPPYSIQVWVRKPSGSLLSFSRTGSNWTVTPASSGDLNFGTSEAGSWTAWADLQDSSGQTYQTASVIWEVAWYPVHARP